MTSDGFFAMNELPKSVVVLGGGYIAVELSQMLKGLGVEEVTLVARSSLLKILDQDIIDALEIELERSGVKLLKGSSHKSVKKNTTNDDLTVTLENGTEIKCQKVLSAIGRPPNTKELQLEKAGL